MKKLILKDATINKVQFDTEWFYKLEYGVLSKEDLSEVDYIFLPFTIDGVQSL
jgi:hypothetical protein